MNKTYLVRYFYTSWPSDQDYSKVSKVQQTDLVNAESKEDALRIIKECERLDGCEINVVYCNLAPTKGWR